MQTYSVWLRYVDEVSGQARDVFREVKGKSSEHAVQLVLADLNVFHVLDQKVEGPKAMGSVEYFEAKLLRAKAREILTSEEYKELQDIISLAVQYHSGEVDLHQMVHDELPFSVQNRKQAKHKKDIAMKLGRIFHD